MLPSSAQLYLSLNGLEGTLPTEMGLLNLSHLNVFRNSLEGTIPEELWQLTTMRRINLASNRFTGTISNDIGNLLGLLEVHLSQNQFTGSIPLYLGLLTNLGMCECKATYLFFKTIACCLLTDIYVLSQYLQWTFPSPKTE